MSQWKNNSVVLGVEFQIDQFSIKVLGLMINTVALMGQCYKVFFSLVSTSHAVDALDLYYNTPLYCP